MVRLPRGGTRRAAAGAGRARVRAVRRARGHGGHRVADRELVRQRRRSNPFRMAVRHAPTRSHAANDGVDLSGRDAGAVSVAFERDSVLRPGRGRVLVLRHAVVRVRVDDRGFLRNQAPGAELRRALHGVGRRWHHRAGDCRARVRSVRRLPIRVLRGVGARAHRVHFIVAGADAAARAGSAIGPRLSATSTPVQRDALASFSNQTVP